MPRRYTQEEKKYMAKMAIKVVKELDKDYPSFKNYVWAAQHIMKGGAVNNSTDQIVKDILDNMD